MIWTNKYNLPAQLTRQIIRDAERDAYENLDRPSGLIEIRVTELQRPAYVWYLPCNTSLMKKGCKRRCILLRKLEM